MKNEEILKKKKLIIFTESKETGDYLFENLATVFQDKVMFYSSIGGKTYKEEKLLNKNLSREIIKSNYDPNSKSKKDDIRILITTDILAEGINLHRSNVVVNYDLPWNPTRVLQRTGRVNRLGSKFSQVFIYNFFPTTHSDEHLGLELNITNKIQMFHNILGEDAKYLTDGEEVGSQELFNTLNNRKVYTGEEEEEEDSELKYLEMIRKIRDKNPELFAKIKNLPKKARSGFNKKDILENQLITFFRIGKLKKFYHNKNNKSDEITFFDAVNKLECTPLTKKKNKPNNYYNLLSINKAKFELDAQDKNEPNNTNRGRSNVKYIETRLKSNEFKNCNKFTEYDEEFITHVKSMLSLGTMAKKTAQLIKKELEKTLDPIETINILRKYIRTNLINNTKTSDNSFKKREVILSGYLIKV